MRLRQEIQEVSRPGGLKHFAKIKLCTHVAICDPELSSTEPTYTEGARHGQVSGTVVLKAAFASDATVKHIIVVRALPEGLTAQAIAAARSIRFVPATLNGEPVSMWIQLEYNFSIY